MLPGDLTIDKWYHNSNFKYRHLYIILIRRKSCMLWPS